MEDGEFKEELKNLYPAPWTEQAKRIRSPFVALDNTPLNKLNGDEIPENYKKEFYIKLYEDEAKMYYKGIEDAQKAKPLPVNKAEVLDSPTNKIVSYPEQTPLSNNFNQNYGQAYLPTPTPIVTPYIANMFSQQDNNDADTADNICNILNGQYICVEQNKVYYMWNGYIWEEKNYMEFKRSVIDIVQNRYKYVCKNKTNVDINYIRNGCNDKKITDIINIINVKIYISESLLNNDRGLLCVKNGIYDISKQYLYPLIEFKDRYITRMINVPYEPDIKNMCNVFHNFIMDIMSGDIALADFLQRAFGYALIGNPIEQKCIMLVGNGANGKTTLIEAISNLLGNDYCTSMSKKVLMNEDTGSANNASPSIMQLRGKRMAFTSELKRNERIVESQFKKIIGGGKLTGRALYKDMTEFENETTVFIDTNHLPSIETAGSSSEYAIFRRIEIVPFKRMFSEEERDPNLPDLLQTELVQREILAWLIEGTVKYYTNKLLPTEEMLLIKQRFMQSENSILRFSEACIYKTNCDKDFVSSRSLYECYLEFCNQNGFDEIGSTLFFKSEVISGLKRHRTSKERG